MHQAELHLGRGEDRLDRFGKPFQPVHTRNEDILNAPVLQLGDDLQPELRSFGFRRPHPQHILHPVDRHAERQVNGFVDDPPLGADFDLDGIQIQNGIDGIEGPVRQARTSSRTASVTVEIKLGETSTPYTSSKWP